MTDDGLSITIRKSKTDQEGASRKIGIPYGSRRETCPVRSYIKWLSVSGIQYGAVFRGVTKGGQVKNDRLSDKGVARRMRDWILKYTPATVYGAILRLQQLVRA